MGSKILIDITNTLKSSTEITITVLDLIKTFKPGFSNQIYIYSSLNQDLVYVLHSGIFGNHQKLERQR